MLATGTLQIWPVTRMAPIIQMAASEYHFAHISASTSQVDFGG